MAGTMASFSTVPGKIRKQVLFDLDSTVGVSEAICSVYGGFQNAGRVRWPFCTPSGRVLRALTRVEWLRTAF